MNKKLTLVFLSVSAIFLLNSSAIIGSELAIRSHLKPTLIRDRGTHGDKQCSAIAQLYESIIGDDVYTVKRLLNGSAAPNVQGAEGAELLELSILYGNQEIVEEFKTHGAHSTPPVALLHYAAQYNHYPLAQYLVCDKKFDVNACRDCLITPLHDAAFHGHYEVTQFLLNHGANVNAINFWGKTPLHDALSQHKWPVAALLLNCTDLNRKDQSGIALWQLIIKETAKFASAEIQNDVDKISITTLLKAAVNHPTDPSSKISSLHAACYYSNSRAVVMALKAGADVKLQNFHGATPLSDAIDCAAFTQSATVSKEIFLNQFKIVLQLLAAGADPNQKDPKGETPFAMAVRNNLIELAAKLLELNADPNQPLEGYSTILHYCAAKNRPNLARHALRYGANKDAVDCDGLSPLQSAYLYESRDVEELLSRES